MNGTTRFGTPTVKAFALAWGVWACAGPSNPARAQSPAPADVGYQGFGLKYHLGYGYGGDAIGIGPNGGYPFYGGPGYLHPGPRLRRFAPEQPYPYLGGPGAPTAACPNVFGPAGPLSVRGEVARERDTPDVGYGGYTGALPYPETLFAPYASASSPDDAAPGADPADAAPTRSDDPSAPAPPAPAPIKPPTPARDLGIDEEASVGEKGERGVKVSRVHPGTAAEKAGLKPGDVIRSINGYVTTERGNLAWIVANAAPDNVLKMSVRAAGDGKDRTITARLR
jgi:hypothetical protein